MWCIRCESERTRKDGQTRLGGQRRRCNDFGRRFTVRSTSSFLHHGFPDDVIALAGRWYVRYRLSYAAVGDKPVRIFGLVRITTLAARSLGLTLVVACIVDPTKCSLPPFIHGTSTSTLHLGVYGFLTS
jgi:hypothetical protein